jgi:alkylation response protein AidB-like acyl-CoA dehydrogenase
VIATRVEDMVQPVADDIRRMAAQAEAERRLPDELLAGLMNAGLFSIYTPKQFGGLDLPLPEALRVVEETSRHDGSTGWTVALGLVNGLMTSAIADESARRVLGNGSVLIAGSPALSVRAVAVEGGYRLTGRWAYNSGAPNASWIAIAAPVFDGDTPRMGEGGPEMIVSFFPGPDAQIIDTWHVTGLRASGTQDLVVEDLFVPQEMTGGFVMPAGPRPVRDAAITRLPFFTVLGLVQSPPVCLGLARHAIEEFHAMAIARRSTFGSMLSEQSAVQVGLARAEGLVSSARCWWYQKVEQAWETAVDGKTMSAEERALTRIASLTVVENCLEAVDTVYRLAGSGAIFQSSPLERCWRDVHTAAQHMQTQTVRWETAGRVMLGLEPGSPIL